MHPKWPVEIVTDEAVACGAVLVRHRGRPRLTVVVKATFSLVHGGPMLPGAPAPIAREDRPFEGSPARSLETASDLAPYLPRCDVLFRGCAYSQKGQAAPAGAARLAVFRDAQPLLDKTIHVFAQSGAGRDPRHALPHAVQASAAGGADQLFSRMPIVYERAFGGPDVEANPAGTKTPNLVDAADPRRPAGFGPIAPSWAARRRLFGARRPDPESLPDDLEWGYFQAAPPDQQIEHLRGGEWLVLDGLHPVLARLQTQVPAARGAARVLSRDARQSPPRGAGGAGPGESVEFVADTLFIDGDAHQCSITWRGRVPITGSGERMSEVTVLAGLELPERPVAWARLAAQVVSRARPARAAPEEAPRSAKHQRMTLSVEQLGAVAVAAPIPFAGPASGRSPARDGEVQPRTDATPWGPPSGRGAPVADPQRETVAPPLPSPPSARSPLPFVASAAPEPAPVSPPVPSSPLTPLSPPAPLSPPVSLSPLPPVVPLPLSPPAPLSPARPVSPPEPPAAPIAVEPPPLVGPIQAPFTPAPGAATPPAAPKPDVPPPLPRSLGKGNLGADQVAAFLKAFDLPPGGAK